MLQILYLVLFVALAPIQGVLAALESTLKNLVGLKIIVLNRAMYNLFGKALAYFLYTSFDYPLCCPPSPPPFSRLYVFCFRIMLSYFLFYPNDD